jgi:hypothetical protein
MKFTQGRLCLTFDDRHFAAWLDALPLFDRYQAHATFFICGEINEEAANVMSSLKQHSHSVGLHGLTHAKALDFVSGHGLQGYWERELIPQLEACRKYGFECRAFAYPYSQRNEETDALLLRHFDVLRTGQFERTGMAENDKLFFDANDTGKRLVLGTSLTNHFDLQEAVQMIERIGRTKEQIIFYAHSILPVGKHSHHISLGDLEFLLECAKKNNVQVTGLTE